MAIIRWNPWNLASAFDDNEWEFPTVSGFSKVMGQGLNIYETDTLVKAEIALPGIPEDKVDVSIDDGVVRISATSAQKQEEKDQRKYFMSSMASSYNYSFRLPEGIAADQEPEAVLENGVLTLSFPKAEVVPPKKIKVLGRGSSKQISDKSKTV